MEPTRIEQQGGTTDELALLRAARSERAPDGAAGRALAALSVVAGVTAAGAPAAATTPLVAGLGKWLATGALLGAVSAGSVHVLSRPERAPGASVPSGAQALDPRFELPPRAPAAVDAKAPLEAAPSPAQEEPAPSPSLPRLSPAEMVRPGTLAEERALLERARAALGAGATGEASYALARHAERFRNGSLADEAAVLRIELALARGDTALAVTLCDAHLALRPSGPHTARVQAMRARALGPR